MANTNIINAVFGSGLCAVTTSAFRANYGMVLRFSGIELPTAFEVDFSNYDVMGRDSITMIGQNGEVQIPDDLWDSGLNIYAYIYLHPTDDSGVTVYTVTIPVLGRPNRTEEQPTPHEQTLIEQAISALNDAVEQTAADVVAADASAQAAALSEANAESSERAAAASASAALASQNAAESAAQGATEQASGAAESARNAANSASQAAESATNAQASAEQAERSVQSITDDVERAERAAQTATDKATEAASSASSAASAAQNAAESEQAAESHATDAETAKQDAQDAKEAAEAAQAAAEQAAESVSGLSEQIEQNTADIADLVQSKAGALVDTVSGSIASFVPDATVPTVRGLTVDIEPQQDLHGYDNPWPAGGGKNKFSPSNVTFKKWHLQSNALKTVADSSTYVTYSVQNDTINIVTSGTYYGVLFTVESVAYDRILSVSGSYSGAIYCYLFEDYVDNAAITASGNRTVVIPANSSGYVGFCSAQAQTCQLYLQIESGSTATAYSPYSNICPISGWDAVEVDRTGVNLFDIHGDVSFIYDGVAIQDDKIVISSIGSGSTSRVYYSKKYPAGTYTISMAFSGDIEYTRVFSPVSFVGGAYNAYYGGYYTQLVGGLKTVTFTEPFSIGIIVAGTARGQGEVYDIQLELGSTATAYTPYLGQSYQIQLGQTVYGGTVDAVKGVLTVDRAMVDLGTLTWQVGSGGIHHYTTLSDALTMNGTPSICEQYSNHGYISNGWASLQVGEYAIYNNTLRIYDDTNLTAAEFKQLVSGVQLVYELSTPITIDLTPIEVAVITGQTNNIWADSGNVSVEYAADLKTYIDQKIAAAVAALS